MPSEKSGQCADLVSVPRAAEMIGVELGALRMRISRGRARVVRQGGRVWVERGEVERLRRVASLYNEARSLSGVV